MAVDGIDLPTVVRVAAVRSKERLSLCETLRLPHVDAKEAIRLFAACYACVLKRQRCRRSARCVALPRVSASELSARVTATAPQCQRQKCAVMTRRPCPAACCTLYQNDKYLCREDARRERAPRAVLQRTMLRRRSAFTTRSVICAEQDVQCASAMLRYDAHVSTDAVTRMHTQRDMRCKSR